MFRVYGLVCSLVCCVKLFADGAPSIAVFMDFESEPSARALAQMEHEILNIMKPAGLQFDWRMMKNRRTGESFDDLVVFNFKGSCEEDHPLLYNELGPVVETQALASTKISEGHILP